MSERDESMLEHPAAWRGEELRRNSDWRQQWTDPELDELVELAASVKPADRFGVVLETTERGVLLERLADTHLARRAASIQNELEHGCGAVWLQGLDADHFSLEQLQRLFWAICCLTGTPVSQTAKGDRLFHVRDEAFGEHDPRTRGPNTNKQLSFHTDRCDVIAFLCVRNALEGGDNQIVSSMTLYNAIAKQRPDLLKALTESYLYQRHNVDLNHPEPYIQQPIFSIYEGHFAANLLRVLIERAYAADDTPAMTELQREALDFVESLAESPSRHITFRQNRGDLVFLNNFVTFHRRTAFADHPDPSLRRHLLRVWLSMPNSRPLDPRFAGNYGATAAGAIRGGIHGTPAGGNRSFDVRT